MWLMPLCTEVGKSSPKKWHRDLKIVRAWGLSLSREECSRPSAKKVLHWAAWGEPARRPGICKRREGGLPGKTMETVQGEERSLVSPQNIWEVIEAFWAKTFRVHILQEKLPMLEWWKYGNMKKNPTTKGQAWRTAPEIKIIMGICCNCAQTQPWIF